MQTKPIRGCQQRQMAVPLLPGLLPALPWACQARTWEEKGFGLTFSSERFAVQFDVWSSKGEESLPDINPLSCFIGRMEPATGFTGHEQGSPQTPVSGCCAG